jgi:hypothetical protein
VTSWPSTPPDRGPKHARGDEQRRRRQWVAPCFCLAEGIERATRAASESGGERQSRRECRLGDRGEEVGAEADG